MSYFEQLAADNCRPIQSITKQSDLAPPAADITGPFMTGGEQDWNVPADEWFAQESLTSQITDAPTVDSQNQWPTDPADKAGIFSMSPAVPPNEQAIMKVEDTQTALLEAAGPSTSNPPVSQHETSIPEARVQGQSAFKPEPIHNTPGVPEPGNAPGLALPERKMVTIEVPRKHQDHTAATAGRNTIANKTAIPDIVEGQATQHKLSAMAADHINKPVARVANPKSQFTPANVPAPAMPMVPPPGNQTQLASDVVADGIASPAVNKATVAAGKQLPGIPAVYRSANVPKSSSRTEANNGWPAQEKRRGPHYNRPQPRRTKVFNAPPELGQNELIERYYLSRF